MTNHLLYHMNYKGFTGAVETDNGVYTYVKCVKGHRNNDILIAETPKRGGAYRAFTQMMDDYVNDLKELRL